MTTRSYAASTALPVRWIAAALAVVLLVALGVALGRVTAPDAGTGVQNASEAQPSGQEPAAVGPVRVEAGVPMGYAPTREGAVAAAAQYLLVLDSPLLLEEQHLDEALAVLASDSHRDSLRTSLRDGGALLAERLNLTADDPASVWRSVPAGWRIDHFDPATVTVAVWGTAVLFSDVGTPVAPTWGTTEVSLRWEHGDWKLESLHTSDGPAPPAPTAAAGSAATAAAQIHGFTPFRYAPALEA